ncbi:type II and III secretion system protein, partial [Methylobacterium sp. CCH5-D2]|uniref:type II secretion system protein GspD n=1 Tax=Methylobacterium sp. CCH5-D2 TaxID=1768765 RepID=UPI000A9994EB
SARIGNALRVDAVLRALQGVTKVKVISSPYLTVLNGKQARLVIGDQIPYAQRSQSANNLGNTTVTQEIVIKDTGIILDITPQIHVNNSVALKVNQSVSTPSQSVLAGNLTPVISTRSVESDILLQSGRTVLLAGLIQDRLEQQEDGVPVLKTVPVVGDFFKQKVDNVRRVELILLLTPRVTRNASQIEDLARLLQEQVHTR